MDSRRLEDSFYVEFNRLEFRVFLLLGWLLYQIERV